MLKVAPDYYPNFKCIASACKHNCCIGWEIDIDEATADFYTRVEGALGKRLADHISKTDPPYFILDENKRCPFLNKENLCDLILGLGEHHLCTVCARHPRFQNELPGRVESGLGLCCEAAAALILGQSKPMRLKTEGRSRVQDQIIDLRDELLALLQDRAQSIPRRLTTMLERLGTVLPEKSPSQWATVLLSLERLEEEWTEKLTALQSTSFDLAAFDAYMAPRQTEYENLAVYFLYRHFANAPTLSDTPPRAAFAALAVEILHVLGAVHYARFGSFTFADQVELARLFSAEIEYSDENFHALLDLLYHRPL